jgi:hypothetical protein
MKDPTDGRDIPATNMFYLFHRYYKDKELDEEKKANVTQYLMPKLKTDTDHNMENFAHRPVIPAPQLVLPGRLPVIFEE